MATKKQDAGYLQQKIVAALERHITPDATIREHQFLPVLDGDEGEKREVDVLIEQGTEPRLTRTIVEVQKRDRKPSRDVFAGWLKKREEVGASHLICVSEAGFTAPQMRMAREHGPVIRLLTLTQLEGDSNPLPPVLTPTDYTVVKYERLNAYTIDPHHLMKVDPNRDTTLPPDPDEKIFRVPNGTEVSAGDLVDFHLFRFPKNLEELPRNKSILLNIAYGPWLPNDPALMYAKDCGGTWVPLCSINIQMRLIVQENPIEWTASKYEQLNFAGGTDHEMAWVLRGRAKSKGGSEIDVIATLNEVNPGEYRFGYIHTLNDADAFVAIGDKGFKAQPIANPPSAS